MSDKQDDKLSSLVGQYLDRLNEGQGIDPEEVLIEHPDLGPEILEELRAFLDLARGPELEEAGPLGTLGDYTLRRQIGRGGMGVVYEAWENSMGRRVALKVLPGGIAADDRAFQRFMREARTAGKLSHPNVVPVFATGIKEQTPYYAMEFVEGETLAQVLVGLKKAEPESDTAFGKKDCAGYFEKLARAFSDAADGLQHAHSKGVIHRDIKPSNLILDREGRLRILDFGLSRFEGQESLTLTGEFLGTPLYMSPEQARRVKIPVDHRTDIYSLGTTLYEVIAGRPPFQGKDHQDTLSQIIEREPIELRKLAPGIPRDLETIVLKCLRKEPADRYCTAEALGQDLRRFVRGDPVEARPMTGCERTLRRLWRARFRLVFAGTMTSLLVVSIGLGLLMWSRHHDRVVAEYQRLVNESLATLELPLVTTPGQEIEGESLSLGVVYPGDLARRHGGRELFQEALASLERAVQLRPERPEAYLGMSRALRALGRHADAVSCLEEAIALEPDFLPALIQRHNRLSMVGPQQTDGAELMEIPSRLRSGWEELWLAAHLACVRGAWAKADDLYQSLLDQGGEPFVGFEVEVRLRRGRVALKRQARWRAEQDFGLLAEKWPGAVGPALLLATTYFFGDQKEAAVETAEHVMARHPGPSAITTAAALLQSIGESEQARKALERIDDAGTRSAAMAQWLYDAGRYEEATAAVREARAHGAETSRIVELLAWSHFLTGRIDQCRETIEEGLAAHPGDIGLLTLLGKYHHYTYDILKAREVLLPLQTDEAYHLLGKGYWELEEFEQALAAFSRAIEVYPRHAEAYGMRAAVQYYAGSPQAAVDAATQALSVNPTYWDPIAILLAVYSPETESLFAPHWDKLYLAFSAGVRHEPSNPRLLGLLGLSALKKTQPSVEEALTHASRGVDASGGTNAVALAFLAEVEFARGQTAEAVRLLERAADGYDRFPAQLRRLDMTRRSLFPALASCASVDWYLAAMESMPQDVEAVRRSLARSRPDLGLYLEARQLQRRAEEAQALVLLEQFDLRYRSGDETAILALARARASRGDRRAALALIEDELLTPGKGTPRAWFEWLRLASQPPVMSARELLARRPLAVEAEVGTGFAADLLWLLKELDRGGAIRIDCGAFRDFTDSEGRAWSMDRFADGGYWWGNPAVRVTGTLSPHLHNSRRWWFGNGSAREGGSGYRIPLPAGRYEVALHFSRVYPFPPTPANRTIDVLLNDQVALTGYVLGENGTNVADIRRLEVTVIGGVLKIAFRLSWRADVAAIEVVRLGDPVSER